MKNRKEPIAKSPNSLLSNLKFHMLSAKKWNKKLFYFQILAVLPGVLSGYIGALIPARIVAALEQKSELQVLLGSILVLSGIMFLCDLSYNTMHEYLYRNSMALTLYYDKLCFRKMMRIDYDKIEEPQNQKLIGNVWNVLRNEFSIRNSVTGMPQLLAAMLGVIWYGMVIAFYSPLIVVLLILSVLISFGLVSKVGKIHERKSKEIGIYSREVDYVNRQAMERTAGKDVRLYQMQDWFLGKYRSSLKAMDRIYGYIHRCHFFRCIAENTVLYVAELFCYGYLMYLLTVGKITVADVVLCTSLVDTFAGQFGMMIWRIMDLIPFNTSITYIREFLNMKEERKRGSGVGKELLEEIKANGVKVELKNVSYTYPGKKTPTLHNINLVIKPNEKLALIGLNGAGKTTLVKLLCGFYQPTEGEILINNIPVMEYTRDEYEELLSVLFQDSAMLPLTLDTNLTGQKGENVDRNRLKKVLGLSGFLPRYEALSKKGSTLLVREINEEATDFSGGEKQKALFARALYKKTPLLILDEPTAALDPIAENELYEKYSEAAKNRTSIFISHRLSSTRFCDRIILLENAEIREVGTHEELLEKGGRYFELYELQSKWYREEKEGDSNDEAGLEVCVETF